MRRAMLIAAWCGAASAFPILLPLRGEPSRPGRAAASHAWRIHPTGYGADTADGDDWPAWEVALVHRHAALLDRIRCAEQHVVHVLEALEMPVGDTN